MNKIEAFRNNQNSILYKLIPGKPSPDEVCSKEIIEGNDTRIRVLQKGSNGWCWLGALHTISERIGKNHTEELQERRNHEALCSKKRKDIAAIENVIQTHFSGNNILSTLNRDLIMQDLSNLLKNGVDYFAEVAEALILNEFPAFFSYVDKFILQTEHENFGSFIINLFYYSDILPRINQFQASLLFEYFSSGIGNLETSKILAEFPKFFSYANQFINQTEHNNFKEFICNYYRQNPISYYSDIKNQLPLNSILFQLSKASAKKIYEQKALKMLSYRILNQFPEFPRFVDDFLSQTWYKNFREFIVSHYQWIETDKINQEFFKSIKQPIEKLLNQSADKDPILQQLSQSEEKTFEYLCRVDPTYNKLANRSWNYLSLFEHYLFRDRYITYAIAKLYELKISSWTPFQTINDLIKELKEKGPLVISGTFHVSAYTAPYSQYRKKVSQHTILAWPPGTKIENSFIHHVVTLIGAKKDQKLVYYVDPNDPSDPAAPQKKPIYAIPYQELQEGIVNLTNISPNDCATSPSGYAWASKSFHPIVAQKKNSPNEVINEEVTELYNSCLVPKPTNNINL